jgi:CRP-like cAMP-binding protein
VSLADSLGRSADVVTLQESVFLLIDREAFRATAEEVPDGGGTSRGCSAAGSGWPTPTRGCSAPSTSPAGSPRRYRPSPVSTGSFSRRGHFIPVPLTQSDLAALIGGSRVRVNQALGYFRRHEAISVDPHRPITVHDEEVLSRRARSLRRGRA